jgi:hypothetical protein
MIISAYIIYLIINEIIVSQLFHLVIAYLHFVYLHILIDFASFCLFSSKVICLWWILFNKKKKFVVVNWSISVHNFLCQIYQIRIFFLVT